MMITKLQIRLVVLILLPFLYGCDTIYLTKQPVTVKVIDLLRNEPVSHATVSFLPASGHDAQDPKSK
jgi:hypothetical protein